MDAILKVKKTHPDAVIPKRATDGAAALDLTAALDAPIVIAPHKTALISTGIAIELPSDKYAALVISRSGLGIKSGISLVNSVGVIDSDYRGTIQIGLINHSDTPFTVNHGDRLAQLLITEVFSLPLVEVESLSDTARGEGGFGSTGKQ